MDAATGNIQSIPGEAVSGITTIVTSPGTPSRVLSSSSAIPSDKDDVDSVLLAALDEGTLVCRGATLGSPTTTTTGAAAPDDEELTCRALAVCALVSDCLVIDGVTVGDVESGLRNSRHARTLSALFRSRLMTAAADGGGSGRQTLLLAVSGSDVDKAILEQDVEALFKAIAVERKESVGSFSDLYDLRVVPCDSKVRLLLFGQL